MGSSSTAQAQANQQSNQQRAENYLNNLISSMTGKLGAYQAANPSPASQWAAINKPVSRGGTYGGGQAGGQPTYGRVAVAGGTPYRPQMSLAQSLAGMKPPSGSKAG